jgi:hypothetical protein
MFLVVPVLMSTLFSPYTTWQHPAYRYGWDSKSNLRRVYTSLSFVLGPHTKHRTTILCLPLSPTCQTILRSMPLKRRSMKTQMIVTVPKRAGVAAVAQGRFSQHDTGCSCRCWANTATVVSALFGPRHRRHNKQASADP